MEELAVRTPPPAADVPDALSEAGSDVPTLDSQLREARTLRWRYKRKLRHHKKEVEEITTHKLSLLAAEDLSPAFTAGGALLQDYTVNADILDELLEATGATDHEEVMNCVEDDLNELKSLQTKLHRLVTIRQTYIDSVVVKAKTKFLLTSRNFYGTEEKKQYDVLLLHVSQVGAVIDSLQSPELRALHEELEERTELIESKKIEASDVAEKAAFSSPDKTAVPVVPPSRTSIITLKLPIFDGKMINWRNFWSLFSSQLEHEPVLLDVDKSSLLVNR